MLGGWSGSWAPDSMSRTLPTQLLNRACLEYSALLVLSCNMCKFAIDHVYTLKTWMYCRFGLYNEWVFEEVFFCCAGVTALIFPAWLLIIFMVTLHTHLDMKCIDNIQAVNLLQPG